MSMSEAVSHSDMSPCRKAKCRARHPGTHLYTGYCDFSCRQSFVWLKTLHSWSCWQPFQFPKEKWDFDGINVHLTDKKQELAALKKKEQNILSLVKQSMEAAPRSAVEYQEKCQQLHSEWVTSFRKDTASITFPCSQLLPAWPSLGLVASSGPLWTCVASFLFWCS